MVACGRSDTHVYPSALIAQRCTHPIMFVGARLKSPPQIYARRADPHADLGHQCGLHASTDCKCASQESAYSTTARTGMKGKYNAKQDGLSSPNSLQEQGLCDGSIPPIPAASRTCHQATPRFPRQVLLHPQKGMPNVCAHQGADTRIPCAD